MLDSLRNRGFEVVADNHRRYPKTTIELPVRGDNRSAGYDIKTPVKITLQPNERTVVWTDIKAYMLSNEVLELHVRSSVGIKKGVVLSNITGIIDSSYYSNEGNDGNIGLALWNTSNKEVTFEAGERICQGIFKTYLTVDNDVCLSDKRTGGIGSSGK
jgi:dUTP pyrophosphatase